MEHQHQQQQSMIMKRRRRKTANCFYYNNIMFFIVLAMRIISISRITTSNSNAPIQPLPSSPQHHSLYHRCNITRKNNNNDNHNDNASTTIVTSFISEDDTNVQIIRDSLRQEYPEIDTLLYSNRYIKLIMNVPGRSLLKCHEKLRNSLQWRRSYNVNKLCNAFIYTTTTYQQQQQHQRVFEEDDDVDNDYGIFIPLDQQNQNQNQTDNTNSNNYYNNSSSSSSFFIPTSELIEVCASGAFVIKRNKTIEVVMINDDVDDVDVDINSKDEDEDHHVDDDQDHNNNDQKQQQKRRKRKEKMLILYADTSRLNWWKTGVIAGLQYHVLVLEQALEQIRRSNHNTKSNDNNNNNNIHKEEEDREVLSESIIVCVDTTNRRRRRNNGCNIRGSRNGRGRERERRNSWSRRNSSSSSYLPMPIPPPLSAIRGLVELMQKGYPTRIYRIYIGPIHPWLRRLYNYILPTMKPRSRKKIILLSEAPTNLDKLTGKLTANII